jgi:hypothetical protein
MNDLQQKVNVPISIANTTLTQEYEGDFSTRRFIVSTYQFIAKSFIYGKTSTGPMVTASNLNIFDTTGITLNTKIGITE